MEIVSVEGFLKYYSGIRQRTLNVIERIPPDQIEWTYREGKWTLGDIIRHIAALERWMWCETVQGRTTLYEGCGRDLADGYDEILAYFNRLHEESLAIFGALTEADLAKKCTTPAGHPITTWKWLRALVEHEIHHRGQIFTYLSMLGVEPGALYGLTSEQVAERRAD